MRATLTSSTGRFVTGKMFNDNKLMLRRLALGVGAGIVTMVGLGLVAPLWLAAIGGGGVAGFLQPLLFKDLKYA